MTKKIIVLLLVLLYILNLPAKPGIRSETVEWLIKHDISPELTVMIIATLPVVELRGAIPVGIFFFNFHWTKAAVLSIVGNMIPIPLILLFMDAFVILLRKSRLGRRFTDWLFHRTRHKGKIIERYEALGLSIFVGIPLPGTGGWTGAFAANIFGLNFWKSLLFIFIGVLLAAAAIVILCQTGLIVLK